VINEQIDKGVSAVAVCTGPKIVGNVSCRDIRFTVTTDPDRFMDMKISDFLRRLKKSGSSPNEVGLSSNH
jgi:hypothetical protein